MNLEKLSNSIGKLIKLKKVKLSSNKIITHQNRLNQCKQFKNYQFSIIDNKYEMVNNESDSELSENNFKNDKEITEKKPN